MPSLPWFSQGFMQDSHSCGWTKLPKALRIKRLGKFPPFFPFHFPSNTWNRWSKLRKNCRVNMLCNSPIIAFLFWFVQITGIYPCIYYMYTNIEVFPLKRVQNKTFAFHHQSFHVASLFHCFIYPSQFIQWMAKTSLLFVISAFLFCLSLVNTCFIFCLLPELRVDSQRLENDSSKKSNT